MRKVIFTENQLRNILGEKYESIIAEIDGDVNRADKTYTKSTIETDDSRDDCGPVTDKAGKETIGRNSIMFPTIRYSTMTENKKKLKEGVNRDFAKQNIYIPQNILEKYDMPQKECTLSHVLRDGFISPQNAYKEISEYKKGLNTLPKEMITFLQNHLNMLEYSSKQRKQNMASRGVENVYQKAGGTKNSGNGKSHTKKNNF